jgi:TrmH family RNA methyltransferase
MINKNELKYIQSFAHKKHWAQESVFIVEGPKMMQELLAADWELQSIYATADWADEMEDPSLPITVVGEDDLERMSLLQTANKVLAVVKKKQFAAPLIYDNKITLVLDGIQDPGNLGTIIRTADWFGCHQIVASEDTADFYNPKVIQSTMGSFLRVRMEKLSLESLLGEQSLPIFGAMLEGSSLKTTPIKAPGFLVIGNESKGIRPAIKSKITQGILIPKFGEAESLNAAVATGILLYHWKLA